MESLVDLFLAEVIEGRAITRAIKKHIIKNQILLFEKWEQLNPTPEPTKEQKTKKR